MKLHTLWMLRCRFGVGWGCGGVGHVRIHVKLRMLWMLRCRFGVGLGWGGACSHSCEVAHAVDVMFIATAMFQP